MHHFTYSILPHSAGISESEIVKQAYLLNNPMFAVRLEKGSSKKTIPESFSMVSCQNAILETIKPTENGDGYILRMYEPYNRSGTVCVQSGLPITNAQKCDLLENVQKDALPIRMEADGRTFFIPIQAFEIVTLRVWFDTGMRD